MAGGISVPKGSFITLEAMVFSTDTFSVVSVSTDSYEAYINDQLVGEVSEIDCAAQGCVVIQLVTRN